jgi:uncharacterized protein YraI
MKRLITSLLLAVSCSIATPPVQAQYGYACTRDYGSSVNLRRGPTRGYPVVASIPAGSPVRFLSWVWGGDSMRWYRVESSGLVGFAREDYLCP